MSFAACSRILEPRRLLTSAWAFLSEHRRERYLNAASKSASSSFSLHFSFDLLTGRLLRSRAPPAMQLSASSETATPAWFSAARAVDHASFTRSCSRRRQLRFNWASKAD